RFAWNTATSFGLGGYLLAGGIAWSALELESFWAYLPGVLAALIAGYVVSTCFGALTTRNASRLASCLIAGVGVAMATLIVGVLAFGAANVFLAWLEDVAALRTGLGPFISLGHSFGGFVVRPMFSALLFGGWIAVLLGLVYGALVYSRNKGGVPMNSTRSI